MVVRTLPARAGLTWLRDALRLYRRQPFAFTSLVILYTIGVSLLAYVPFVGLPLAAVLIPFGTIGLTLAGRDAERGTMPMPILMVEPFRDPQQRKALARLGFVNAGLVLMLVLLVSLLAADELANWKLVDGQLDRDLRRTKLSVGRDRRRGDCLRADSDGDLVRTPVGRVAWAACRQGAVLFILRVLAQPLAFLDAGGGTVCAFVRRHFRRHSARCRCSALPRNWHRCCSRRSR